VKTTIDPFIDADPLLRPLVKNANEILERTIGPASSPGVSAEWKLVTDPQKRSLLQLCLSDFTGSVPPAAFAPDELKSDWHTRGRMLRLWGDLLEVRSHQQLEGLLKWSSDRGTD
jgi:hypothetical protein